MAVKAPRMVRCYGRGWLAATMQDMAGNRHVWFIRGPTKLPLDPGFSSEKG